MLIASGRKAATNQVLEKALGGVMYRERCGRDGRRNRLGGFTLAHVVIRERAGDAAVLRREEQPGRYFCSGELELAERTWL